MFYVTPDHSYLAWYSAKKTADKSKIDIKKILKIDTGFDSLLANKIKSKDSLETAISIYYGKSLEKKDHEILNVVAGNNEEKICWVQGLLILAQSSSKKALTTRGINIGKLNGLFPLTCDEKKDESENKLAMPQINDKNLTTDKLLSEYGKIKHKLQLDLDFIMTKKNYTIIARAGQFARVKYKLGDLDNRLREIKEGLHSVSASKQTLLEAKCKLRKCEIDIDALLQHMQVVVKQSGALQK